MDITWVMNALYVISIFIVLQVLQQETQFEIKYPKVLSIRSIPLRGMACILELSCDVGSRGLLGAAPQ